MRRVAVIAYGVLAYLAFLVPVGYLVGFVGDVAVPKSVDRGAGPFGDALWMDLALLAVFGIQHSLMARPAFKRWLETWIPPSLERSTYVLTSGVLLSLVFWLWQPVPGILWNVERTWLGGAAWIGFVVGWAVAVWATFALSHLHLFGLAQVAARAGGDQHPKLGLRTPRLYRVVRHPMTAGMLLAFWSTPRMTVGHLIFAAGMTIYCLGATVLEERDLLRTFPDGYRAYRRKVPALVPFLRPGVVGSRSGGLGWELSILAAGMVVVFAALSLPGRREGAGTVSDAAGTVETVVVDGLPRTYRVFHPPEVTLHAGGKAPSIGRGAGSDGRPLVLALHGSGGDSERFRGFLGGELERRAGSRGWIVAYPEAWEGSWNDCRRAAASRQRKAGIDDTAFLEALVSRLVAEGGADPRRIFVLGYSGGGHLAFRIALEAPELARGVTAFGANLPTIEANLCRPRGTPPPLMLVNGTADPINPHGGGEVVTPSGLRLGPVRSSEETAAYFRARASDPRAVESVTMEGGGHSVPGSASRFPPAAGPTIRSWEGIAEALDFFAGYGAS